MVFKFHLQWFLELSFQDFNDILFSPRASGKLSFPFLDLRSDMRREKEKPFDVGNTSGVCGEVDQLWKRTAIPYLPAAEQ